MCELMFIIVFMCVYIFYFEFMWLYIVYIIYIIFGVHFFIALAAYWSLFVTNTQFINLFFVIVVKLRFMKLNAIKIVSVVVGLYC